MTKRARPVRFRSPAPARLAGCNPAAASRGREPDAGKAHRASSSGGCGSASNAGRGLRVFSNMVRRNTRSGPSCRRRHKRGRRLTCRNVGNVGNPPRLPRLVIGISLAEIAESPPGSSDRHGLQLGQISPSPQFPPRETVRSFAVSAKGCSPTEEGLRTCRNCGNLILLPDSAVAAVWSALALRPQTRRASFAALTGAGKWI